MRLAGDTLVARSERDMWLKEQDGTKANTVRIVSPQEWTETRGCGGTRICVVDAGTGAHFEREITDVSVVGEFAGQRIVVISWKHEAESFATDCGADFCDLVTKPDVVQDYHCEHVAECRAALARQLIPAQEVA